jgi:hypothetical protein
MSQSVKQNLLAAFRYLLKPLVRMAVTSGVSYPDFSEALKKAYVDVAAKQMTSSKMDVTEEGISLIAHVDVQAVREILRTADGSKYGKAAHEVSPVAIVLGAWHSDAKYLGPYGVLRDLRFSDPMASVGSNIDRDKNNSFSDLVRTYCPGISPQVVLDELLRIGAIQDVGNGFYRALRRSYIPHAMSAESILYVARVMHNLAETLETNLRAAEGGVLIERSIFTAYGIPKKLHPSFDAFIRARGQAFADDIDNWITPYDVEGLTDGVKIGVSFYHYVVNEEDESALSKELPN